MNYEKIKQIKRKFYTVTALYNISISLFSAIIYLYMESIGHTLSEINLFISVFWIVSFVSEIPSGIFSDSFGRRNTMVISCMIRGVGLFLLFLDDRNLIVLIISSILAALGSALCSGTMTSWVFDEVKKWDADYDFNKIFSYSSFFNGTISLVVGYAGAQILGKMNLGYPIVLSGISLVLTAVFTMLLIENDRTNENSIHLSNAFTEYKNTFIDSIHFAKENRMYLLACIAFTSVAIITTAPFNQWQIYFKDDSLGIISGYIHIFLSLFAMAGAYFASRIKSKHSISFFLYSNVLICITLVLSVCIKNLWYSLVFFLLHVFLMTAEEVVMFTYLNSFLNDQTRTTLLSFYYTLEALVTVFVMNFSSFISNFVGLGNTWIVLCGIGISVVIPIYIMLRKSQQPSENVL